MNGHGWVTPNADGSKARCGGPAICSSCAREAAAAGLPTFANGSAIQTAPFPYELSDLVAALRYKPSWTFTLEHVDRGQGSEGLTLCILITCPDAYHPQRQRSVMHYMPVPPAAFERRSWQRWLLDQVLAVEVHKACEFFTVDGVHPFAPNHGPGRNPYAVVEYADDVDRRTSFRGEVYADEFKGSLHAEGECPHCDGIRRARAAAGLTTPTFER